MTVGAGLATNGDLWLRVADTGIGIAQTELERVFEPFTRLDNSLARRYGGAGLGLYTARAIVNARAAISSSPAGLVRERARSLMPGRRLVY